MNASFNHSAAGEAAHLTPEEALARFQERFPVERTRDMAALCTGTPAEREAAAFRIAARAMERNVQTPADHAVRGLLTDSELVGLSKGHRQYNRENRRVGGSR